MSLINKMLQDLEARNDASAGKKPQDIAYQDLRPVRITSFAPPRRGLKLALAFTLVVAAGVLAWSQWGPDIIAGGEKLVAHIQAKLEKERQPAPDTAVVARDTAGRQLAPAEIKPLPSIAAVPPPQAVAGTAEAGAPAKVASAPPAAPPAPVARPRRAPSRAAVSKGTATGPGQMEKKVKPMSPEDEAEGHYQQAATHLQQGRRGDAEDGLRAALAANPAHAPARELLAGLALQNGRTVEAQQLLEEGLQKNPKHYSSAQLLARLYVDQGAEQKALALMEGAGEAGATDPAFLAFLGTLYQRAGRHADAVAAYTKAVNLRPGEGRWWLGLGISLEAEKNLGAASDAYTRAQQSGALDQNLQRYVEQRLAAIKNK